MRSRLALLAAFAATLTLTAAHRAPMPDGGLLVAVGERTFWLPLEGDSMRLAWQAPELVVPRSDGWWFVVGAARCGLDIDAAHGGGGIGYDYAFVTRYQALAIARAGMRVDVPLSESMECDVASDTIGKVRAWKYRAALDSAKGDSAKVDLPAPGAPDEPDLDCIDSNQRVTFLSATAMSVEDRYRQTEACAPGGYTTSGTNSVVRIGTDSSIALRPMLAPAVRRKAERQRGNNADGCAFEDTPGRLDDAWIVKRQPGRWVADIWLDGNNACRGGREHELDIPLPRRFTGEPALPVAMSALEKAYPGTMDATVSPSGALIALLSQDTLTVHRLQGTHVGPPLVRVGGMAYGSFVMIRWATPAESLRWTRELPAQVSPTVRVTTH